MKTKVTNKDIEPNEYMPEPSEIIEVDNTQDANDAAPGIDDFVDEQPIKTEIIPLYSSPDEQKRVEHLHRFYTVEQKFTKSGEYAGHKIELDNFAIIEVLRELGFCRYDQPNGSFEYVYIKNNIITLLKDSQVIVDAFEDYIMKLPIRKIKIEGSKPIRIRLDEKTNTEYLQIPSIEINSEILLRKVYKNIMYYFSSTLPRLRPDQPIRLLEDTKDSKYIFYNNCIVRISNDGIQTIEYDEIDTVVNGVFNENNGTYIWSNNILNRDFPTNFISCDGKKLHTYDSDFEIFIDCICGLANGLTEEKDGKIIYHKSNWRVDLKVQDGEGIIPLKRKQALCNIFGYLMHNNYECNMKSVMFIDMNKENIGKPAGGTGKGIIGKALSQMLNRSENDSKYIAVAGKNFDPEDERRYSEGDITTQLIHIEDIKSSFRFEGFFNDVTDGAVFRKMYQDKTRHRVKLMLSSNQAIDLSAPSCKRRMVVFELDNFFNEHKTPQDVFGKRFFESQWSKNDWGMFDAFMIRCCYEYMKEKDTIGADGKVIGLRQPPLLNYTNTLLYSKLNEDFIIWFTDKIADSQKYMIEKAFSKKGLYTEFSEKYTEFANEQKYKRAFAAWCKFYLQTMQIPSAEKRSTEDLLILYPKEDPKITYIYK
jgi:hypothetical protein